MKRFLLALVAVFFSLAAGALAQGPDDLNSGSRLVFSGSTGTFSWWGVSGNTYLIETSDDLINWSYLPVVESGGGSAIQWGLSSNSSSLFLKLEYITVPASDLPVTAFNGPLDTNGLRGDWELFLFGQLGVDPNVDPNGQGFTVAQDYEYGMNPDANQVVSAGQAVGEYLFHETSGTVAHDISSLHNNGLLSGTAGWDSSGGYDGEGEVTFDGTTGEVLISDTGNQVVPTTGGPFSLAFWFQPNSNLSGTTSLISAGVSGTTGFEVGINWTASPPNLFFLTSGSNGVYLEMPITSSSGWAQAAVTFDGTYASIYLNGSQQVTGTGTFVSGTSTITLAQGFGGGHPFAGAMEDLTFYQAVLNPLDVTALYDVSTTGTGIDPSGLPNWWKQEYFGTLNVDPSAIVTWSGSTTVLQAYENGWNPNDYFNGQMAVVTAVSGTYQFAYQGDFAPSPLVVNVTDPSGHPLAGAPVTFYVIIGGGAVQASSTAVSGSQVTVFTDVNGNAQVYFQLPPGSEYSFDGILALAGPDDDPYSGFYYIGAFDSEYQDPSPFEPTNVRGVINSDGSESISWQNNDTSSSIYIYGKSGGSWSVAATLSPGTTSYTASSSMVGSVEVGNIYSPGGSTGNTSDTGGGDPGTKPTVATSGQGYAVIDLSAAVTSSNVMAIALDDTNNAAFAFSPSNGTVVVKGWSDGTTRTIQTINPPVNWQYVSEQGHTINRTQNLIGGVLLTPSGVVYGGITEAYQYPPAPQTFSISLSYSASGGDITLLGAMPSVIDDPVYYDAFIIYYTSFWIRVCSGNNADFAGTGIGASYGGNPYGYIYSGGSYTYFVDPTETGNVPDWAPSGNTIQGPGHSFYPVGMNGSGEMIYNNSSPSNVQSYGLWNGTSIVSLSLNPISINNGGEIVGNTIDSSSYETGTGVLWEPATQTATPLASLSGSTTLIEKLSQIGDTWPSLVSNANATDGSRQVLFFDINSVPYVLTLDASSNVTELSSVELPPGVTISKYQSINANGIIAALGTPNTSGTLNHALLLLPTALVPDYNHDGKIDGSDMAQQSGANPYRFWINNSDLSGDDIPGPGSWTPSYSTWSINGLGDLDNWFPVYLNITQMLAFYPPTSYTYELKQADSAIKFTYTSLTPDQSGSYLTNLSTANTLVENTSEGIANGTVFQVTGTGSVPLGAPFLESIQSGTGGVLLCEATATSQNPLELVVYDSSNNQVADVQMPMSLSGIESMYRQINLMSAAGGSGGIQTTLSQPPNYPDTLCNSQNFVFVHGYNVNPQQARGWNAEIFKRMYWSGSRAKFYGVTWNGAESQQTIGSITFTPDYQSNVRNAFVTAGSFATFVNGLGGNVTVAGHSLGNMLVSSAIEDWDASITNYYMIDAAVPIEAYQGAATEEPDMDISDWSDYPTNVWASEWHLDPALPPNDGRVSLTWRDRFVHVPLVNTYNFYSGSEDVLRKQVGDPTVITAGQTALTSGLYAWALQEKLKGNRINLSVTSLVGVEAFIGSTYGGWGFTGDYIASSGGAPHTPSATEASSISNQGLLTMPVFDPGYTLGYPPPPSGASRVVHPGAPSWIPNLTNPGQASATAIAHESQLLAEMFPSLTLAVGGEGGGSIGSLFGSNNFDMPALFITNSADWPYQSDSYNSDLLWHHSDIKNVDYPDLYLLFQTFVSLGGLNQ